MDMIIRRKLPPRTVDMHFISVKVHTCKQNGQLKSIKVGEINDVQADMKQIIIDNCSDDATKSATEVAKHVSETTVQKYEGIFFDITLQQRCNLK